jgi:ADP-ribose pyrophosphatase
MLVRREPIYSGSVVDLGLETVVLPTGKTCELEIIRHPGGATALAVDAENQVCLLRQYRHATGGWMWELPAGKIDPGEQPEETARRELAEEAGVSAKEWTHLGKMASSPGIFTEVVHLYYARNLAKTDSNVHADEVLEVHWIDMEEALNWVASGKIYDAKSVIALLWATHPALRS